jgi:hypothetical protein
VLLLVVIAKNNILLFGNIIKVPSEYRQNKESVKIFNSIDLYWKEGYMYNDVPESSVLSELQF